MTPADPLRLVLFATRPELIRRARASGIDSMIVDWEWRGKEERQSGADTEINRDTPEDLRCLRSLAVPYRFCRINRFGSWTAQEVETAVAAGATDLLLPMVERPQEVAATLELAGDRSRVGILVETETGVGMAPEFAGLPIHRVYVGLNDLAISRGSASIFDALADGTIDELRRVFFRIPFGFGGVTVVDGGEPVPCRLLLGEMARLRCSFSFLRRSFKRDIAGRHMPAEVERIRRLWYRLQQRSPQEEHRDRAGLAAILSSTPVGAPS